MAEIFRADILDVSPSSMVLEIVGKEDKLRALTDLLEPYGETGSQCSDGPMNWVKRRRRP